MSHFNEFGQPIGSPLPGWKPPARPSRHTLEGRYCRVVPLDESHTNDLYAAMLLDDDDRQWTYLPYGPFATLDEYSAWVRAAAETSDPLVFAIVSAATGKAVGIAAYLRIFPENGSIEVGHLFFSQHLKRTAAATEAMFLMMKEAFDLGYRRYEWKCDAYNAPSRAAAGRLGFTFEGIFRQATVYKERTRDTAWFSVIDSEWPRLSDAFTSWLAPANFDAAGRQKQSLSALVRAARP
jgi:RimJ/RimL family protein N-acetyltransferase